MHRVRPPLWLLCLLLPAVGCGSELRSDAALPGPIDMEGPVASWPTHGGPPGGSHYSPLRQITRENVAHLQVAWEFHTEDFPGGRLAGERPPGLEAVGKTAFQATPILDEGTLYLCSPLNRVFALDAETGALRWVHDARPQVSEGAWTVTCRGVALWRGPGAGVCARRIFMGTLDARLVAIDAASGEPCWDFGSAGEVDLTAGLGDVQPGEYYVTSPPTVVQDVVVVGALVGDGRRVDGPGGVIRAFDVHSGVLRWAFDPAPPDRDPIPPGPEGVPRFHRGTPNAWSILSADLERDLLYVPFGGASPDYYGGARGNLDYYGSAVVALFGSTGEVAWRFQTVHHDLWDYDVASQPALIDVPVAGARVAALAQATKMGHVFLLDRETGEPLHPVKERAVPPSDVPGETNASTQPFPTLPPPLHPERLDPDDAYGLTPLDRRWCRNRIRELRNQGIFTPPSLEGSIHYPGSAGGANWGGVAHDPERNLLVLNQSRIAQVETLVPREEAAERGVDPARPGVMNQEGTPYLLVQQVITSPLGVPCSPPPWGTLLAVDLESGEKRWEVPFGTTRDMLSPILGQPGFRDSALLGGIAKLAARIAPWFTPQLDWGFPSLGGPIVTGGGLVFIGAAMDDYFRAYDVASGEELWRVRLPAGGQATPMTYRLGPGSRQFVVLAAGGHGTMGTRLGDSVIAYALPEAPPD